MKGLAFLAVLVVLTGCSATRSSGKPPTQLGNGLVNGFPSDPAMRAPEGSRDLDKREDEVLRQQQEIDRQEQELQRQQGSFERPEVGTCLSCPDGR